MTPFITSGIPAAAARTPGDKAVHKKFILAADQTPPIPGSERQDAKMPHRMTAMRPCRPDVASIAPETAIIGTPAFIALLWLRYPQEILSGLIDPAEVARPKGAAPNRHLSRPNPMPTALVEKEVCANGNSRTSR